MVATGSRGRATAMVALGVVWALTAGACIHRPKPRPTTTTTATTPRSGRTVVATGTEARSAVARQQVPADAAGPAVSAIAALGASLYRGTAAGAPGRNVAISPLSIETALAMTRNGAVGETRTEMDQVLGATGAASGEVLDRALNALDATLVAHNGSVNDGYTTAEVGLRTSNALWAQDGFVLYADFLDTLARHYGAGVNVVDFTHAAVAARVRINAYVAEHTNGRIPELLAEGTLGSDTRLVLTNTLWFKAPWAWPFNARGDLPFHLADGSTVAVPAMAQRPGDSGGVPGGYGEGPGWKAAELPYVGRTMSMVVIVPDDLAGFEAGLDGARLTAITGGLHGDLQSVTMPKWTTRTALELPDQLANLGMRRAFGGQAQFQALSPESLSIDDVVHQVYVAVDEKGTEAAAATAVIMHDAYHLPQGTALVVDRPFVYAIRDVATGAILFVGRVVDPSKVDG
jgi:serpin B